MTFEEFAAKAAADEKALEAARDRAAEAEVAFTHAKENFEDLAKRSRASRSILRQLRDEGVDL